MAAGVAEPGPQTSSPWRVLHPQRVRAGVFFFGLGGGGDAAPSILVKAGATIHLLFEWEVCGCQWISTKKSFSPVGIGGLDLELNPWLMWVNGKAPPKTPNHRFGSTPPIVREARL